MKSPKKSPQRRKQTTAQSPNKKPVLSFAFHNMGQHFERTFELWTIKNPSIKIQLYRSLVFVASLLITIYWPVHDLLLEALLLALFWILLSLTNRRVYHVILMTNIMLNISLFFYLTQVYMPHLLHQ